MLALGTTEAKYGFDELRGYISKTTDPPVCSFTTISKSGISNPCWRIDTAAGSAPGYSSHILVWRMSVRGLSSTWKESMRA